MTIEDKINESKRRTQIINGITIDWQYAQQISPVVFSMLSKESELQNNEDYNKLCSVLHGLCDNIQTNIDNLKSIIPMHFNK